jgi:ribonuclease P protein component
MAALCLPRSAKLLQRNDFAALRTTSARLSTRLVVAEYRPTTNGHARLGMAVSRRVSKKAVVRNRIRRVMRESFRLQRAALPSVDILLIARAASAEQANPSLRADLDTIWRRLIALVEAPSLKEPGAIGTMRAV